MKVRGLTPEGDWKFGQGTANYVSDNDAILQNVATRIKSFKGDWFLDSEAHIDWFNILSLKNNEDLIKSEVERVTLETEGVIRVNKIELIKTGERSIRIEINLDTIFTAENKLEVKI